MSHIIYDRKKLKYIIKELNKTGIHVNEVILAMDEAVKVSDAKKYNFSPYICNSFRKSAVVKEITRLVSFNIELAFGKTILNFFRVSVFSSSRKRILTITFKGSIFKRFTLVDGKTDTKDREGTYATFSTYLVEYPNMYKYFKYLLRKLQRELDS